MFKNAIKYKKTFEILRVVYRNYKNDPSSEKWNKGEKMCQFLEQFYDHKHDVWYILFHVKLVFYINLKN